MKKTLIAIFCLSLVCSISAQHHQEAAKIVKEEDYYQINTIPIPENVELEVGGMTFLPNDALAVCTRRGEVWVISNPYMKNGTFPRFKLFASGLHEALGLNYINGDLYATQRSEITRLRDLDGDGEADEYKTVYTWPLSGNYHEYAYGPILDKEGNFVVNLNLAWTYKEESQSPWHGWMLKVSPDGKMKPFAAGLRSPAALANIDGDLFYTENQGGWVGSGFLAHVEEGDFLGNPEGLRWANLPGSPVKISAADVPDTDEPKYDVAKRFPALKTPAVWFPQSILGISTSGILQYNKTAKMGPFEGQLFVGDQGHSKIMRVYLEKVKGVYQGVAFPFREGFNSGILRMNWGTDGSMFVGMTSRGWGSTGTEKFGLQQLVWTGKDPFEMKEVKAMPDGFEIIFTSPADRKTAAAASSYELNGFTYKYGHKYGSEVINNAGCPIKAIEVSPDNLKVRLVVDSLRLGYIHEIKAAGVRSADSLFPLLHNVGYYTLNNFPEGNKLAITADNRVKTSAPAKETAAKTTASKTAATKASATKTALAKRTTKKPAQWTKADQVIVMTPIPGLKFNTSEITVRAGAKVQLTFKNTDDMLHNIVFTVPGGADDVGNQALQLGLDGQKMSFIPNTPKVLYHTALLQPGQSETIYFNAPEKPGDYSYLCTYPGHHIVMRGIMKVVAK